MEELEAQLRRIFTPEDALGLMWEDYGMDASVVRLTCDEEKVMGSIKENDDGFYCEVGSLDHEEPMFGLRHDYQQARVCLSWMKDFDEAVSRMALTPEEISEFTMGVPDIPPYDPQFVDVSIGQRKFEAPMIRADYKQIMAKLGLCAPPGGTVLDDATMTGVQEPRRRNGEPMFLGRSQAPLSNAVYLRFNPLTSAGAALVKHVVKDGTRLVGEYEVRGKMYHFNYEMYNPTDHGRYTVSPDEWVPRLQIKSFDLLAFDMVADYDFWPYPAQVYNPTPSPSRAVPVRDRIVPAGYRFVDYDPKKPCYHQKTLAKVDKDQPHYIMHHGSSRVHLVEAVVVEERAGLYVRLELAEDHVTDAIVVRELKYEDQNTGIYVTTAPSEFLDPARWGLGKQLRMVYAEGKKNAIQIEMDGYSAYVFRAKNLGPSRTASEDQLLNKHDVPLCGMLTNPASSHVLLSGQYFRLQGEKRYAFTTHFMHAGVYNSVHESVALKGVDIFQYTVATHTAARLRTLYDLRGEEVWEDALIVEAEADAVGGIVSEAPETQLDKIYREMCDKLHGD